MASDCGVCVYTSDLGIYVKDNPVAYINPACPDHNPETYEKYLKELDNGKQNTDNGVERLG